MAEPTTKAKRRRRPRGDGSIYETGSGRWRGAIVWQDPGTGAKTRHAVSGPTFEVARDRMRELRRQLEDGGRPTSKTPLGAYLASWLKAEEQRVASSTYRARRQFVELHIVPAIGKIPLADLRPSDVERMTAAIVAKGRSGQTAMHARATLRRALGAAQRDGIILRNAAALSGAPKVERRDMTLLTQDQVRQLIAATEDEALGPLWAVAATTGLRQGEVLGLEWRDVEGLDGPSPRIHVRRTMARTADGWGLADTKTKTSRRDLALGATAARALRRERLRQKERRVAAGDLWQDRDGLMFTDALGRPLRGTNVSGSFSAALKRHGLPHVRFHDLRHGVASMMLKAGVPLKVISDTLGHSTIVITANLYTHTDQEQQRQAADALERAIGGEA
jgi:integrase